MSAARGVTVIDAKFKRRDFANADIWSVTDAGVLHVKTSATAKTVISFAPGAWQTVTDTESHGQRFTLGQAMNRPGSSMAMLPTNVAAPLEIGGLPPP